MILVNFYENQQLNILLWSKAPHGTLLLRCILNKLLINKLLKFCLMNVWLVLIVMELMEVDVLRWILDKNVQIVL